MSHTTKLTLAFGTRKLRAECALLKGQLIGSEGHVKELMRVNDQMVAGMYKRIVKLEP